MNVLLVQLPIPKINFGLNTSNIPLAAACLKQAAASVPGCRVEILSPDICSHAGDQALVSAIAALKPDIVGFTVFSWNRDRSVFLAREVKEQTGAGILFGGPEVTEDTVDAFPNGLGRCIQGEGEAVFRNIIASQNLWAPCPDTRLSPLSPGSPYVNGHLKLGQDRVMLLETQRGCPYHCGFCYYSKARKKRDIADDETVLRGISWAIENNAAEIYLMDPSLNARPGLKHLLDRIQAMNGDNPIPLISEIRAESITPEMAARYAASGFKAFEVGLQSTNRKALDIMSRPTRLPRFLDGVNALKDAGIRPTIDLIFGLPGDTPAGFRNTVDFILENELEEEVQVFPLLVLPGTAFRANRRELGLDHAKEPPYPVIQTPDFSPQEIEDALDYAEERLDRTFYPYPDLDASFCHSRGGDYFVSLDDSPYLAKLVITAPRPETEIQALGQRICSPFQMIFLGSAPDQTEIRKMVRIISTANPFVPMELIFYLPEHLPDTEALLAASRTPRPHFLDLDQRFLYPEPGNRSMMFTVVSRQRQQIFQGPMKRQVFLWDSTDLPDAAQLLNLAHLDGILIDGPEERIRPWQDRIFPQYEELPLISFTRISMQVRWMTLTDGTRYQTNVFVNY